MTSKRSEYVINIERLPGSENASRFDGQVRKHGCRAAQADQHPPGSPNGNGVARVTSEALPASQGGRATLRWRALAGDAAPEQGVQQDAKRVVGRAADTL